MKKVDFSVDCHAVQAPLAMTEKKLLYDSRNSVGCGFSPPAKDSRILR